MEPSPKKEYNTCKQLIIETTMHDGPNEPRNAKHNAKQYCRIIEVESSTNDVHCTSSSCTSNMVRQVAFHSPPSKPNIQRSRPVDLERRPSRS